MILFNKDKYKSANKFHPSVLVKGKGFQKSFLHLILAHLGPVMCVCWIYFVSERWIYVMLLSIKYLSRKHFSSFSEKKVCVSRQSQGRHLCSLLTEEQMRNTVLFWLILEQIFQKPGTSGAFLSLQFTADLPKQRSQMKTQFPSPQNTQKGPCVPLSK